MKELTTYTHELGEIRAMEENGEILFCASDVASALGYADTPKAIKLHCKKDGWANYPVTDNLGRTQQAKFINEGNLYRLIIKSKLQQAEQFEKWVFEEVLPSIRQHGVYATPTKIEDILGDPDSFITLLQNLKEERSKNTKLEQVNSDLAVKNTIMKPKSDYFDELVDRNLLTNFRETAKELEVKEKAFIKFLLEKKYIYRDKKGKLVPFAGKGDELFATKECFNEKTQWGGTQTLVTPKGRETFRLLVQGL